VHQGRAQRRRIGRRHAFEQIAFARQRQRQRGEGGVERTVAEQRPVLTGVRQDGFVEIKDGVAAGDKLVADGLNKVQPGAPIRPAGGRPGSKPPMAGAGAGAGGARPAA